MQYIGAMNATVSETARKLGVSRHTVYAYLKDTQCQKHFVVYRNGQWQLFTLRGGV